MTRNATPYSNANAIATAPGRLDTATRGWLLGGLMLAGLFAVVPIVVTLATPIVFVEQPISKTAVYRIFFLHVPAAVAGTTTLMIGLLIAAVGYLWRRTPVWARLQVACLELGWLALTFALVSGMIWGNSVWGQPWNWEPRLTLVAVMWLMFVGALALRGAVDDPGKRDLFTAIVSILIVLNAPLIKMATEWFGHTLHPARDSHREADGYGAVYGELLICMIAINLLFVVLAVVRVRTSRGGAGGRRPSETSS